MWKSSQETECPFSQYKNLLRVDDDVMNQLQIATKNGVNFNDKTVSLHCTPTPCASGHDNTGLFHNSTPPSLEVR